MQTLLARDVSLKQELKQLGEFGTENMSRLTSVHFLSILYRKEIIGRTCLATLPDQCFTLKSRNNLKQVRPLQSLTAHEDNN